MSDILSQDQIDALLNSEANSDLQDSGIIQPSEDKYEAVSKIFELFCNQAGTVISTVLNKKTIFSPQKCQKVDFSIIREKIDTVALSLALPLTTGIEGEFYLIIQKKDVAVLSDLMMMGDGTADYNEDHKDAIGELYNQVMGAFSNAFGLQIGTTVSAGTVEVSEFDSDNPPFDEDSMKMVIISLESSDDLKSETVLLVPSVLCDQILENVSSNNSDSGSVQLNSSELDDLSRITAFDSSNNEFGDQSLDSPSTGQHENIDMLLDIDLDVSIELGRSKQSIKRVLELSPGSIVELDRMAGEPVDLLVNNKVVAKGEVVVIDESFGIRIVSLVSAEERIKSLQ
ncbi:MAG TPA: flagellar motor switch protein FliN [Chitinispirillaceae bacterium]|nr:flagellar motor switch protein FliN [Chitinispirillaceae bacterium]